MAISGRICSVLRNDTANLQDIRFRLLGPVLFTPTGCLPGAAQKPLNRAGIPRPPGIVKRTFVVAILTPLLLCIVLGSRAPALAAVTLAIDPGGRNCFNLSASGMKGITGGKVTIQYEYDGRALPTVEPAELVSLQAVTDAPGVIEIRFKSGSPLSGSDTLAYINFPGRVTSLAGWLQNDQGGTETAGSRITNPPREEKQEPEPSDSEKPGPKAGIADVVQVITVSPDAVAPYRAPFVQSRVSTDQQELKLLPFQRREGALDRFCGHAGVWTTDALNSIFSPVGDGEFRQEPPLLLSDGTAELRVAYRRAGTEEKVEGFLIKGARCSSARIGEPGVWLLVLTPDASGLTASVTVQTDQGMVEYPLTVAPTLRSYNPTPADENTCRKEFVKVANRRGTK